MDNINEYIYFIRGQRVMLDEDLAILYGVLTKRLNEQAYRNIDRFPEDFAFQLTKDEWQTLKSQFATSSSWGGRRKLPYAFTEQGVAMLSSVLRSPQAVSVNIEIMRAFVKLRHVLSTHKELSKEMKELRSFILKHSQKNDHEFKKVWNAIKKLMTPSNSQRKIGFDLNQ